MLEVDGANERQVKEFLALFDNDDSRAILALEEYRIDACEEGGSLVGEYSFS